MNADRRERGQALVEFALVIPIVMLLMCGLFDLGRVVFINNSLSDGARQGARHASVDPRAADYCTVVDDAVRSATRGQPLSTYTVEYQRIDPDGALNGAPLVLCQNGVDGPGKAAIPDAAQPGDRVTVELGANVDLILGFIARATGQSSFGLHAESTMQVTFAP
jgi:Flp pilus assembly protein TadG